MDESSFESYENLAECKSRVLSVFSPVFVVVGFRAALIGIRIEICVFLLSHQIAGDLTCPETYLARGTWLDSFVYAADRMCLRSPLYSHLYSTAVEIQTKMHLTLFV